MLLLTTMTLLAKLVVPQQTFWTNICHTNRLRLVQAKHTPVPFLEPKILNAVQVQACCQLVVLLKLRICTLLVSTKVAYVILSTRTLLLPYSSSQVL